jgi:hypothetical protein
MHALHARLNAQADYAATQSPALRANNAVVAQRLSTHRQAVDRAVNTVAHVVDELPPHAANQTYVDEHLGAELLLKAHLSLKPQSNLLQAASVTALHQTRCVWHNKIAPHRMPDVWYFAQSSKRGSMKKTQNAGGRAEWGAISTTYGSQVVRRKGEQVQIFTTPAHESEHVGQFACGREPQAGQYARAIAPDEKRLDSWAGHPQRGSLEVKASIPLWDHNMALPDRSRNHPLWRLVYRSSPIELVAHRAQTPIDEALAKNRNADLTKRLPMAALGQLAHWVDEALSLLDTAPRSSGHMYQAKLEASWAQARPDVVFRPQTHGAALAQQGRLHAEMGRLHHAAASMAWSDARAAQLARHIGRWSQSDEATQPAGTTQRLAQLTGVLKSFNDKLQADSGVMLYSVAWPTGYSQPEAHKLEAHWQRVKYRPFERLAQLSPHRDRSQPAATPAEVAAELRELVKSSDFLTEVDFLQSQIKAGLVPMGADVARAIKTLTASMLGVPVADMPDLDVVLFEGAPMSDAPVLDAPKMPHYPAYTKADHQTRKPEFTADLGQWHVPLPLLRDPQRLAARVAKMAADTFFHIVQTHDPRTHAPSHDPAYVQAIQKIPHLDTQKPVFGVMLAAQPWPSAAVLNMKWRAETTGVTFQASAVDEWHQIHRGHVKAQARSPLAEAKTQKTAQMVHQSMGLLRMTNPQVALRRSIGQAAQAEFDHVLKQQALVRADSLSKGNFAALSTPTVSAHTRSRRPR